MQLSIFDLQEQNKQQPKEIITINLPKNINKVDIIKIFEYETNVFKATIKIGKINNKFDYTLQYSFQTGTYEGCGIPWNYINDRHLFDTEQLALHHCKKYFLMRISHILERSDTNALQKQEVNKINNFINGMFYDKRY